MADRYVGGYDDASEAGSRAPSSMAGKPSSDANPLKNLNARMNRKSSVASSVCSSQIYDEHGYGFGNFSVPNRNNLGDRSVSAPRLRPKEEVEGSRPRIWKPAKVPMGPPGGEPTFNPSRDGKLDSVPGRKRFPDMGAGANRDAHAVEALRFYQEEERLGKHSGPQYEAQANQKARDTHRYYLAAEGKAQYQPGKARRPSDASSGQVQGFERPPSKSTSAGSDEDELPSECDSLPLGAEWCSPNVLQSGFNREALYGQRRQ